MASVTPLLAGVNSVLPTPPAPLVYVTETINNQQYTTSGAFPPAAPDRKLTSLRWVGALVLDFDLVDYLTHLEGWEGDSSTRKARMYAEYARNDGRLAQLKAQHASDIEAVIDEVRSEVGGSSAPTFAVDSGWGLHVYFWLTEGYEHTEDISIARRVNHELVAHVNSKAGYAMADAGVHDTGTRLMRSFGSLNTQAKEKAGIDFPLPVVLNTDIGDAAARWDMFESARYYTDNSRVFVTKAVGTGTSPAPLSVAGASQVAPSRQLSCLIGWMLREKAVKKLHDSAKTAQDSNKDMSLACGLASHHHGPRIIREVLYSVRNHPNAHDGTDYYDRTAEAAWRFVHQNDDFDADANYTMQHPAAAVHFTPTMSTLSFVSIIAQHDPRVHDMLWVDERTKAIEWETGETGQQLIDRFFSSMEMEAPKIRAYRRLFEDCHIQLLCRWIESVYHVSCTDKWREVAGFIAAGLEKRNPVREYLEECSGSLADDADEALLETWLIKAFGIEDTPLNRTYSRKWLVGGAARGNDPGVFIKSMLVLVGGQSAGKTSMLRILGGQFYDSPHATDLASKDAMMGCNYSWLLEMEEMSFMAKSTMETVKRFITTETDKMRLPYGVGMGTFERACFYAGTSNRMDILADATGGDRFWCVQLPSNAVCDFDFIRSTRDTLWGLAHRAWMSVRGTEKAIWAVNLTRDELAELRSANEDFERVDPAEDGVLYALWQVATCRKGAPVLPLRATWAELGRAMLPAHQRDSFNELTGLSRPEQARLRDILTRAGFEHKVCRVGDKTARFWVAPPAWTTDYNELLEETNAAQLRGDNSGPMPTPFDVKKAIAARAAK